MLTELKKFNLPEIEEKVLKFWRENKIFEKSLAIRQAADKRGSKRGTTKKNFVFYEGPPSANSPPGIHHVLARVFKDIVLRYRTMRGFYVSRRAGWDTHGLPIEVQVERELGLKNKSEIEKLGIAEFNSRARLLVWKYKSDWERLTERIGFWLDFKNPYITYENSYIESLWWAIKKISDSGFLKKHYRVVVWCPRCQTPLSNHELGQPDVYQRVKDPSLYVKFELVPKNKTQKKKEYMLVWTTTPWTLPANVALAVNPKLIYTKYKVDGVFLWSYNAPPKAGGSDIVAVEKITGSKLVGRSYRPLYKSSMSRNREWHKVVGAEFVSTEEGTGVVHIAPAFGEEDLELMLKVGKIKIAEIPITIDDRGFVKSGITGAHKFIKQADQDIVKDLAKRKLLYLSDTIEHEYPHCWRCQSPLIYFARLTWFVEMSRLKKELLANNQRINWVPEHVKYGRFGEWLKDVKDWSFSRERFWGTPLPIWEHARPAAEVRYGRGSAPSNKAGQCSHVLVVGSFDELNKHAFRKNRFFLIRHGEADNNIKNFIAAGPETKRFTSKLTQHGMAQVEQLGKKLVKEKIDLIFHSPYMRAKQTAKILAKHTGAEFIPDKRIGELNTGIFNKGPVEKFHNFFKSLEERWTRRPTGGENLTDVKKRMLAFIKEINSKYQNKNIAIVSHGSPLWVLEVSVAGLKNDAVGKIDELKVGTSQELKFNNWPHDNQGNLDWHRPFVDELILKCPRCGGEMKRVKDLVDVWFDSGAMPYAAWHYPFENKELINGRPIPRQARHAPAKRQRSARPAEAFPADYISEGMDQTRGWFYTLLAVSTLLGRGAPYLNVISLGLLLDKYGQKMSKSKGNVVDPWEMCRKYGADVLRWYFYTAGDPGEPKRFDEQELTKTARKFHLLFYNSFVFLKTYTSGKMIAAKFNPKKATNTLDKWIISRWNETVSDVTEKLDSYQIVPGARKVESFVDDLSHWYIRRSRRRFAENPSEQDFNTAHMTLNFVLHELAKLAAPFCPFLGEAIYRSLRDKRPETKDKVKQSVHLADWPKQDKKLIDEKLLLAMREVRRISSEALALRAQAGIKVRQPLYALRIYESKPEIKRNKDLLQMLKDELNVKEVIFEYSRKKSADKEIELDTKITPELYKEGVIRELVRLVQKLRQDAGYKVGEFIQLRLEASGEIGAIVRENMEQFKRMVKAKKLELTKLKSKSVKNFEAQLETKLNGKTIGVAIKKLK